MNNTNDPSQEQPTFSSHSNSQFKQPENFSDQTTQACTTAPYSTLASYDKYEKTLRLSIPDSQKTDIKNLVEKLVSQWDNGCSEGVCCFTIHCASNRFRLEPQHKDPHYQFLVLVMRNGNRRSLPCQESYLTDLLASLKNVRELGVWKWTGHALPPKDRGRITIRNLFLSYNKKHEEALSAPFSFLIQQTNQSSEGATTSRKIEDGYHLYKFDLNKLQAEIEGAEDREKQQIRKRVNDQVLNFGKLLEVETLMADPSMCHFLFVGFRAHVQVLGAYRQLMEYENTLILRQLLLNISKVLKLYYKMQPQIKDKMPFFFPSVLVAASLSQEEMKYIVFGLKQYIVGMIRVGHKINPKSSSWAESDKEIYRTETLIAALDVLELMFQVNQIIVRGKVQSELFSIGDLCRAPFITREIQAKHLENKTDAIIENEGHREINLNRYAFSQTAFYRENLRKFKREEQKGFLSPGGVDEEIATTVTEIEIDRSDLFQASSAALRQAFNKNQMTKPLEIKYKGEPDIESNGSEFIKTFIRSIFSRQDLFFFSPEKQLYYPNGFSKHWSEHATAFGIATALALVENIPIRFPLPTAFFKTIFDELVTIDDLQELYPELAKSFYFMIDCDGKLEEVVQQQFTINLSLPNGEEIVRELYQGGSIRTITSDNAKEYTERYIDYFFNQQAKSQLLLFKKGFEGTLEQRGVSLDDYDVLSVMSKLAGRNGNRQHLLKCINIVEPLKSTSPCVLRLFTFIEQCSSDECQRLTQFITGTSSLPVAEEPNYIKITELTKYPSDLIPFPEAITCSNELQLPLADTQTQEKFNELLREAIHSTSQTFHRG